VSESGTPPLDILSSVSRILTATKIVCTLLLLRPMERTLSVAVLTRLSSSGSSIYLALTAAAARAASACGLSKATR
jgi:hypothetical protein